MSESALSFTFTYFNATYQARSLGTAAIPSFNEIISAHVIPMTNEGEIIAVNVISRGIDAPGGHVEDSDHSPLETLIREIDEEAQITVHHPVLIDVLEINSNGVDLGGRKYMLIYAASVRDIKSFKPNDEISERHIFTPQEFIDQYFADKTYAKHMVEAATEILADE